MYVLLLSTLQSRLLQAQRNQELIEEEEYYQSVCMLRDSYKYTPNTLRALRQAAQYQNTNSPFFSPYNSNRSSEEKLLKEIKRI